MGKIMRFCYLSRTRKIEHTWTLKLVRLDTLSSLYMRAVKPLEILLYIYVYEAFYGRMYAIMTNIVVL